MKGLIEHIFRSRKKPGIEELREALKQVERDRRRVRTGIRRWERKRALIVERIKLARGNSNAVEVDYLWDELKGHRRWGHDLRRQGRAHNAEGIALRRYVHALEQLENQQDIGRSQVLLHRIQASGLIERLAVAQERDERCLAEVEAVLDEVMPSQETENLDSEKALFLGEIDAIQSLGSRGQGDEATRREEELMDGFEERNDGELG